MCLKSDVPFIWCDLLQVRPFKDVPFAGFATFSKKNFFGTIINFFKVDAMKTSLSTLMVKTSTAKSGYELRFQLGPVWWSLSGQDGSVIFRPSLSQPTERIGTFVENGKW